MISIIGPEDTDVIILCGGLGIRLRSTISDRPKVMAEIKGRPFLDILIDYVSGYGFKRFILCTGYMKDVIRKHYKGRDIGITVLFSEEKDLLGTAGAIKNAEALIRSDPFFVMNGDSFCKIDMKDFLRFHMDKKASVSIALVSSKKEADYGVVALDGNRRIISFNEKIKSGSNSFISAGVYLFNKDVFNFIPLNTSYSLEYDLFPNIIEKGIYGYISGEKLIDIGTPERYKMAEEFLRKIN